MLQKLLSLLEGGRTRSLDDLARDLDTTREMVEAMLGDLERLGYVRQVTGCMHSCQECSMKGSCGPKSAARIWAIVERGKTVRA
jgi:hypothetical protein